MDLQEVLSSWEAEEAEEEVEEEERTSLVFLRPAGAESGPEAAAETDGCSAARSCRPVPSAPRKRAALSRQSEKPSWKESLRAPAAAPGLSGALVFCRKRTVCSRISAFSTRRWAASCKRKNNYKELPGPLLKAAEGWAGGPIRGSCSVTCGATRRPFSLSRLRLILSLRRLST